MQNNPLTYDDPTGHQGRRVPGVCACGGGGGGGRGENLNRTPASARSTAADLPKLSSQQYAEHNRLASKYGQDGYRVLPDGRIRYYGEIRSARNPGEMVGRRMVREWDPKTGQYRTWHETVDANGQVRIVRPVVTDGPKQYYYFDENGDYVGPF